MIPTPVSETQAPPAIAPVANGKPPLPAPATLPSVAKPELRSLPITQLYESPNNPRKRFNPAALAELADSIKTQGVRVPVTVREKPRAGERYEIIAGHRRYRAAKAAGLIEIAALIHVLSDQQALEIMTIDNLQREDVHELEEADGFQAMLDFRGADGKPVHTVQSLARAVGKSIGYIYQRLKYQDLFPGAREAFIGGKISAGHAILIARLQPPEQRETIELVTARDGFDGYSVRDLSSYIDRDIHREISKAAFPIDKADLTAAGACTVCPKRTGINPEIFPDVKRDSCTDPACYQAKVQAFVRLKSVEIAKTGPAPIRLTEKYTGGQYGQKSLPADVLGSDKWRHYESLDARAKTCSSTQTGIFIDGVNAGTVRKMCTNPRCPVHNARAQVSPSEAAQRKAEASAQAREKDVRKRTIAAVLDAQRRPFDRADLEALAVFAVGALYYEKQKEFADIWGIEGDKTNLTSRDWMRPIRKELKDASEAELRKMIVLAACLGSAYGEGDDLAGWAKRYKVDIAGIQKLVAQDHAKKATLQTSAKPAAPAKAAPSKPAPAKKAAAGGRR